MTCQHCQAQTPTGITLCKRCVVRLEDVLSQIEDALEVADDTIAKQDRMGGAGVATGTTEAPSPINLDTMEKRRTLWEEVVSYARLTLEHDDSDDLRNVEPVVYLRMSTELIQHQDYAGELLDALEGAVRKLWAAVDRRPDIIALGQCGAVHESVPCPGRLRAHKGQPETRCKVCGETYGVTEIQQERTAQAWAYYDTLSNVVQALRMSGYKINPKSAQRWAADGELPAIKYREDRVALYSTAQVIAAHHRMRTRKGGRPRRAA